MRVVLFTVFILLFGAVTYLPATAGKLNVSGLWQYSDNSAGIAKDSQNYNVSYSGNTYVTDLIRVNGSLRYSKIIRDDRDSDTISPSLNLHNTNDLYKFSLLSSYSYTTTDEGGESDSWHWGSRLSSAWSNRLWPNLSIHFNQNGSSSNNVSQGGSDSAGFNADWSYFQWLRLLYNASWAQSSGSSGSSSESLRQSASLNGSKSFLDDRLRFSFGQFYSQYEYDRSNLITSAGFALVDDILGLTVSWEEIADPSDNFFTTSEPDLLTDSDSPSTILPIDPAQPPMNLILFTGSQDVEVVHLYTQNDIELFYDQGIDWRLYQSLNGIDNWTPVPGVAGGTLGPGDYDQDEQLITIDFGTPVNNEFIKLVIDPTGLLPAEVTDLETIEVFSKVLGTIGTTVTSTSEDKDWRSNFGMGFSLSNTLQLSYNASYSVREGSNSAKRESLGNNAGLSWSPSQYFKTSINVNDSRLKREDAEEFIGRNYSLSVSSQPLATLSVSSGFSRGESYTGSTLDRASHNYSISANAQLYRDLNASLGLTYSNPQKGGGNDSLSSDLYVSARLAPTLLLNWNSSYDQDLDTSTYSFDNSFHLNWRTSEFMYFNSSLKLNYGSGQDLTTKLSLNTGVTPNRKHRINLGYSIDDHMEDIRQTITADWSWIITRVFYFTLLGNYQLADENSWFMSGSLTARFL